MTAGRMARGLFGGLLGMIAPLLPSFGMPVLTGGDLGIPGLLTLLLLLITVPYGVVLGVGWARQKTRLYRGFRSR
jgi:hypothetical protein